MAENVWQKFRERGFQHSKLVLPNCFQQWPNLIIPQRADSQVGCEPVSTPHVDRRFVVDLSVFPLKNSCHQSHPDKATLPDFQVFPLFLALIVRMFRIFLFFGCVFVVFLCFAACPGLIRMFRILYGLNMRKNGMTGFVGDGFECNPKRGGGRICKRGQSL